MLIVIEGPDGCGKTTMSKRLAKELGATWMCFPDRSTPIGKVIDGYLKRNWRVDGDSMTGGTMSGPLPAYVFQALQIANRVEKLGELALAADPSVDDLVVCDRYWQSGYAYGKYDGCDPQWLIDVHMNLPQPDLSILLDVMPQVAVERLMIAGKPAERYENIAALESIILNYRELWKRGAPRSKWIAVDGDGTQDEVYGEIVARIKKELTIL